jgi:hypothetical protein
MGKRQLPYMPQRLRRCVQQIYHFQSLLPRFILFNQPGKSRNIEGATIPLKRYQFGLIETFKGYMYHCGTLDKPLLSIEDWDEFDHDAFLITSEFRHPGWSCQKPD